MVERSSRICVDATIKLFEKDYALESDVGKVRLGALTMVQHLAGSLAMVTGKESLNKSFYIQLRSMLLNAAAADEKPTPQQVSLVEQAAMQAYQDNLDLACAFIEKSTVDKAIAEIEAHLADDSSNRRLRLREKTHSSAILALPLCLRPKLSGAQLSPPLSITLSVPLSFEVL